VVGSVLVRVGGWWLIGRLIVLGVVGLGLDRAGLLW
jgi:hypothetical protein